MEEDKHTKSLEWCPEADLNHRHADFQSAALPTELSGHFRSLKNLRFLAVGTVWRPESERGYNILFEHGKRHREVF